VSNDGNRVGLVEIFVQYKLAQELECNEIIYDFAAFKGRIVHKKIKLSVS
jgi:hypothetical protein